MTQPRVVIIGAGPAGLTAAYELAEAGVRNVVVLEATGDIGGLSKTVNYKGNRIDIGGHRFFSKSDWVMDWWLRQLPLAGAADPESRAFVLAYQGRRRTLDRMPTASESDERVMLVRGRLSRIYFAGRFFDYPLKANLETALKLGLWRCMLFGASYMRAKLFPRKPERTLEDFFINRFGWRLYLQFFKSYTEKVWGTPCSSISAEWGAQRVKSMSIGKALRHAVLKLLKLDGGRAEQTSLIERFMYPKYGPGLMWETTADRLRERGVQIVMHSPVTRLEMEGGRLRAACARRADGSEQRYEGDVFISTMPVRDLVLSQQPAPWSTATSSPSACFTASSRPRPPAAAARASCRTTGSTSRKRACASAGCRSSTTGARTWCPTRIPSGSAWSSSATRAMTCGARRTRISSSWASPRCTSCGSPTPASAWTGS